MATHTAGLTIRGDLTANEDLTIDGVFEGSIDLKGHLLTMAEGARVNAFVSARVVTVLGRLHGHITADVVDIGPEAIVEANVIAPQIALEEGGSFTGAVNTERARAAGEIARRRARNP
jgi:cytoskeletal protein CcmA (bactofilin family)